MKLRELLLIYFYSGRKEDQYKQIRCYNGLNKLLYINEKKAGLKMDWVIWTTVKNFYDKLCKFSKIKIYVKKKRAV